MGKLRPGKLSDLPTASQGTGAMWGAGLEPSPGLLHCQIRTENPGRPEKNKQNQRTRGKPANHKGGEKASWCLARPLGYWGWWREAPSQGPASLSGSPAPGPKCCGLHLAPCSHLCVPPWGWVMALAPQPACPLYPPMIPPKATRGLCTGLKICPRY